MARFLNIEIGASQMRLAEVEPHGRGERILNCFTCSVPAGAVDDGLVRDTKGLGQLLKNEIARHNIHSKKVFFVTGSSRIASREVRIPFVKKRQIQSLIEANATDYFPVDVSNYVLSYTIIDIETKKNEEENEIRQYHLMVYAAPKSVSTAFSEMAAAAGLTVAGCTSTGDSIYSAVRNEFMEGTHLLFKVEMRNTNISIIRDGELTLQRTVGYGLESAIEVMRSLPEFGEELTPEGALAALYREKYVFPTLDSRIEDNSDDDMDNVRAEITESFRYLIGNIGRIMDYYLSRNTDTVFDSVMCCGAGAGVKGLRTLFKNELQYDIMILNDMERCTLPEFDKGEGLFLYTAVLAPQVSGVNLMEKISKKQGERAENLRSAAFVCTVGVLGGVVLVGAGIGCRMYQEHVRDQLNKRINEENSIEAIYYAYTNAKYNYENFQRMYQYTNTPNEGLKTFLEEMEEKMPSDITVETFSSTGTQVSFSMRVSSKSAAANTLMQLRTFESLSAVTTTGLEESEDGTVSMSVICTYSDPAPMDDETAN